MDVKMYIENRKQKKYSEKLFKELCFYWLLLAGEGRADLYMLNSKLGVSSRTLFRYAKELNECGLVPKLSKRVLRADDKTADFYSFDPRVYRQYERQYLKAHKDDRWSSYDFFQFAEDYPKRNAKESSGQSRLYRCGVLLASNQYTAEPLEYLIDEDEKIPEGLEVFEFEGKEYAFYVNDLCEDIYENLSLRTLQRDLRVVKDVIIYMFEE